jgi:hypothetical protein
MEKNFQRDNYNNSPSLHNFRNRRVQQITSNKIAPLIPTHSYVSSIASTSTSFNDQIKFATHLCTFTRQTGRNVPKVF